MHGFIVFTQPWTTCLRVSFSMISFSKDQWYLFWVLTIWFCHLPYIINTNLIKYFYSEQSNVHLYYNFIYIPKILVRMAIKPLWSIYKDGNICLHNAVTCGSYANNVIFTDIGLAFNNLFFVHCAITVTVCINCRSFSMWCHLKFDSTVSTHFSPSLFEDRKTTHSECAS